MLVLSLRYNFITITRNLRIFMDHLHYSIPFTYYFIRFELKFLRPGNVVEFLIILRHYYYYVYVELLYGI